MMVSPSGTLSTEPCAGSTVVSVCVMPPRIGSNHLRPRRTYFREWREFRGFTQDEVLARLDALGVPFSKPSMSRLENARQPYSEPILLALSEVYRCEPSDLIGRDPSWGESLDAMVAQAAQPDRTRIVSLVQAYLKAS